MTTRPDPEHEMQEPDSWMIWLVMGFFLAVFWLQDKWTRLSVGLRCCASPTKTTNGAARQHGPTQEMKP